LRDGLNRLADRIHTIYAREYKGDPWEARDRYGEVVGRIDGDRPPLLELEKYTLRMFTSCGWFFDDIAGLEAVQILRYAARAIDLAGPEGPALESELLDRLAQARSNDPARGTGRDVFRDLVRGRRAGAS
ncbi:MAG TPA: DUF3536 domain-containing protein, partial [Gemmatimonadales bacterium]|nr:DUF3536 domain-containing protein [Gemmatimonadales bacterium]